MHRLHRLRTAETPGTHRGAKDALKGSKIDLIDVLADNSSTEHAPKRNVTDVLIAHSEVNCLWAFMTTTRATILKHFSRL